VAVTLLRSRILRAFSSSPFLEDAIPAPRNNKALAHFARPRKRLMGQHGTKSIMPCLPFAWNRIQRARTEIIMEISSGPETTSGNPQQGGDQETSVSGLLSNPLLFASMHL
jgi:hypothetical protein